jgi:hypothetical protein
VGGCARLDTSPPPSAVADKRGLERWLAEKSESAKSSRDRVARRAMISLFLVGAPLRSATRPEYLLLGRALRQRSEPMIARVTGILASGILVSSCGGNERGKASDDNPPGASGYRYDGQCDISSGHSGDQLCLGVPEPDEGFQLHYGPDRYDDQKSVEPFLLGPGEELTDCQYMTTPNEAERFWRDYHLRARTGTHHIIVYTGSAAEPPDGTLGECDQGTDMRFFVGAQSGLGPDGVVLDVPLPGKREVAENEGYAQRLGPKARVAFQVHYVNTGDRPILREAWVNFHYRAPDEVKVVMDPIFFIGGLGMDIQPGAHEVVEANGCQLPDSGPSELRIMGLSGHMHAHGVRFSAWKVTAGGTRTLVYDTYDWEEPLNAQFDSGHEYPPPDQVSRADGAWNGLLTIRRGESLDWECEYENDLPTPLRFGNKAYTGEMCNLFGWYAPSVGEPWSCFRE